MNDLDKNTGEWAKVPKAPYIPIKRQEITPGETRLSYPLTVFPSFTNIPGGRIRPGDSYRHLLCYGQLHLSFQNL